MVEIEKTYTEEDCRAMTDLFVNTEGQKKLMVIMRIFAIVLIGFHIWALYSYPYPLKIVLIISLIITLYILVLAFFKNLRRRFLIYQAKKNILRKDVNHRIYIFDEKGCRVKTAKKTKVYPWRMMRSYGEYEHYLWIKITSFVYIFLDKNEMSEEEQEALYKLLEEKSHKQEERSEK